MHLRDGKEAAVTQIQSASKLSGVCEQSSIPTDLRGAERFMPSRRSYAGKPLRGRDALRGKRTFFECYEMGKVLGLGKFSQVSPHCCAVMPVAGLHLRSGYITHTAHAALRPWPRAGRLPVHVAGRRYARGARQMNYQQRWEGPMGFSSPVAKECLGKGGRIALRVYIYVCGLDKLVLLDISTWVTRTL